MQRPQPAKHRHLLIWLAFALVLSGCTGKGGSPGPSPAPDGGPERVAAVLAEALARQDVRAVDFAGGAGPAAARAVPALLAGMGPLRPAVSVSGMDRSGSTATATLRYSWSFPGVPRSWTYPTTAALLQDGGRWQVRWAPTLVHPELTDGTRLSMRRLHPARGELLGEDGDRIVRPRPVVRIGIDKSSVSKPVAATSAARLARLVDINPRRYAAKVAAAGPEAFVEAIVVRARAAERPPNRSVHAIPGALAIEGEQMLAPTRDFARPVIGAVGEASKEIVEAAGGAVVAGDQVGVSGLQRRYDAAMRGTPGVEVSRVPARRSSASPSPSASPTAAAPASPLFQVRPVPGQDLRTTLNVYLQRLAEDTLAKTAPASALVAIRPSTGAVVAAANGPGSGGQSVATVGQYPPGSTFKVATSLALLRAGLTPDSPVACPRTLTVEGRRFTNYRDYPPSALGRIDLRTAVAQSCNTAFLGQRRTISQTELAEAAASLGVGVDYDVGFASFFGSVPVDPTATGRAAALIGQGKVQASPLSMAGVAASVAAGTTVIPHLVEGNVATPRAKPLTAAEARSLRVLLRAVVTEGSGKVLRQAGGPAVIAKTGTAEYGTRTPPRTHAWMIAATDDLAVAVFVADGKSGSETAGPLLARFLSRAR